MALLFLDSSALVKRYVPETGSVWVKEATDPASSNRLYVARITGAEVVAAITRRQRRGDILFSEASLVLASFRLDFPAAFSVIEVSAAVVSRAMDIAEKHGLRGYDAVQLAAALSLAAQCRSLGISPPLVVTADTDLNTAALAEGLAIDNPNMHA